MRLRADSFRPELREFSRRVLKSAIELTPARDLSLIRSNQSKQYDNRANYIPSIHDTVDPMLIVKDDEHWLLCNGKWFKANEWHLNDDVYAVYVDLLQEHYRRLETPRGEFIAERAQARFLYKRAWFEVALSAGIPVEIDANIQKAHSRHEPPKDPPKGYAQWRGGKHVLTLVCYAPLLDEPSRYKDFGSKEILQKAIDLHSAWFMGEINVKLIRLTTFQ